MKPTVGLVSRTHVVPISHSQDTAGPMTASVREAAELLTVIAGSDPADPATAEADRHKGDYAAALDADSLKGKRIGVMRFAAGFGTDAAFETALAVLRERGATLVEIKKFDDSAIGKNEFKVLLTELKADLGAYLEGSPAPIPVRSLADVIAFNKAHAQQEMPLFGQDLFEEAEKTKGLDDPAYKKARRDQLPRGGPERDRPAAEAVRCRRAGRPDHAAGVEDRRGQRRQVHRAAAPAAWRPSPAIRTSPCRWDWSKGLPGGPQLHRAEMVEALLLSLGFAYEQARGPFPTPKFYRSIEESPEIAPHAEARAALGGEPERRDRRDDGEDQQDADRARRLVEPQDADDHRADGADPAPDGIGRAHRDRARGDLEQAHADRDRDQEGERPRHVAEAVDEAQRGGEPDLEQPADDQPQPGHDKSFHWTRASARYARAPWRSGEPSAT